MAYAVENAGTGGWVSGTTFTVSVTLSGNPRRRLAVWPMLASASATFTSVVFDAGGADEATMILMTDGSQAASFRQGNCLNEVYELLEVDLPGAGAYTVTVTLSTASVAGAGAGYRQTRDVNQSTPHRNVFVGGAASNNDPTIAITDAVAGDIAEDYGAAVFPTGRTFSIDGGPSQVEDVNAEPESGSFSLGSHEPVPSTATHTLNWTASAGGGARNWAWIGSAFIEDVGAASENINVKRPRRVQEVF